MKDLLLPWEQPDKGYGFCPNCGTPLDNWGASSRGDGSIYDEIGCDTCQEVIRTEPDRF